MSTEFNSIDDFLNHSGSDRRGGGFLKGWKKDGHVDVWLHTKQFPLGLWQHRFPRLVVREDKDTGESTKSFFSGAYNCWETEAVLKKQYHLTPDGAREAPPEACPLCKLIDHVRQMVVDGKLSWTAPVFEFRGSTDAKYDVTLHAGGLYNAFGGKLTDREKEEMKRAGISPREAFRENGLAKLQYVFCTVRNDKPEDGVQIAVETKLLGTKVKKVINDTMASLGKEDGNPMVKPYCFQFVYDENAESFNDMYHARRIERHKLTPEIEKLIRGEAPDLTQAIAPFNAASLRSVCEKYAKIELPWDDIFSAAQPGDRELAAEDDDEELVERPKRQMKAPPPPPPSSSRALTKETGMIPCDGCKKPMPEDAAKCHNCGATYEIVEDEPAPPPKKRGRGTGAKLPF